MRGKRSVEIQRRHGLCPLTSQSDTREEKTAHNGVSACDEYMCKAWRRNNTPGPPQKQCSSARAGENLQAEKGPGVLRTSGAPSKAGGLRIGQRGRGGA